MTNQTEFAYLAQQQFIFSLKLRPLTHRIPYSVSLYPSSYEKRHPKQALLVLNRMARVGHALGYDRIDRFSHPSGFKSTLTDLPCLAGKTLTTYLNS